MKNGKTGLLVSQVGGGTFDKLTTAHEISHIMGVAHEWDQFSITPFGRGYTTQSGKICTIMGGPGPKPTYKLLRCRLINYFSNPKKTLYNERIGIEIFGDAARWLRTNRFVLQDVGDESIPCEDGSQAGYNTYLMKCLTRRPNSTWTQCGSKRPIYYEYDYEN